MRCLVSQGDMLPLSDSVPIAVPVSRILFIVKGLTERLGADHHLTTAYSKEQNGLVERQNKEVLKHLRNIIHDRRVASKWSKYLPIVQRIINTSVNRTTGVAPADITSISEWTSIR